MENCAIKFLVIAFVGLQFQLTSVLSLSPYQEPLLCTSEQHRPRYHFSPAQYWINDPNGLIYYEGIYHLFYQYHPQSTVWGPMHWGHAKSGNLVSWEEVGIALEPDELGDIFSGSAVVDNTNTTGFKASNDVDPIVAIYTSASGENHLVQKQSLAYSIDNGVTFQKYEKNPVLVDENSPDFRDPKVFFHATTRKWVMSLAVANKIEFYSSPNLKKWTKMSEFGGKPEIGNHRGVWECPDLIPVMVELNNGTKIKELWVLLVSINPGGPNQGSATQYFIGVFNGTTFNSFDWSHTQWIDWGPDNYAGVTFYNEPTGRSIYIGWMNNWLYGNELPTSAWRGQMTIPRSIGLIALDQTKNQYRLTSAPAEELQDLREPGQTYELSEEFKLPSQTVTCLTERANFSTPLMELEITLEIFNEPQFSICAYNSYNEEVCFGFNHTTWFLDRTKSGNTGFSQGFTKTLLSTATRELSNTQITIRMFFDVSSVEVFTDDGVTTMTSLYYPTEAFNMLYLNHWSKTGSKSTVKVNNFKVWGLRCWQKPSADSTTTPRQVDSTTILPQADSSSSPLNSWNLLVAVFLVCTHGLRLGICSFKKS